MTYPPPEPWLGPGESVNGLAPRTLRLAAAILDGLLLSAFPMVALAALMRSGAGALAAGRPLGPLDGNLKLLLVTAGVASLLLTVYQWVLLSVRGQTLGKRALGLRIYRLDGTTPAGFVHALLLRSWVFGLATGALQLLLQPFLLGIGLILFLLDVLPIFGGDRRCLHDHLAGTEVRWAEPRPRLALPLLAVLAVGSVGALGFFVDSGVEVGRLAAERGLTRPGAPLTPEALARLLVGPGGEARLEAATRRLRTRGAGADGEARRPAGDGTRAPSLADELEARADALRGPEKVPGVEVLPDRPADAAPTRILRYVDEEGVVHFTDDEASIPARYREAAVEVD